MNDQRNMYSHMLHHYEHKTNPLHDKCKKYMSFHVIIRMQDGSSVDGILEDVSNDHVSLLVPEDVMMESDEENSGEERYGGYGSYGRPRRRFRRFVRRVLPLVLLAALSPYPYYPYPYPYPYYPYY